MAAAPLGGRRIALTRATGRSAGLAELVRNAGASALEFPLIAFVAAAPGGRLDETVRNAASYEWIAFASATAVQAFADRAAALQASLGSARLAAVGTATASAVSERIRNPDLVSSGSGGAALAADLLRHGVRGPVLMPGADIASPAGAEALASAGVPVDTVTAYHTVPGDGVRSLRDALAAQQLDAVLFTSPSTVRYLSSAMHNGDGQCATEWPAVICIGHTTAAAASELGIPVSAVATESSAAGLVTALIEWFDPSHEE